MVKIKIWTHDAVPRVVSLQRCETHEWSGVFTDKLTQKSLQKMLSNSFFH